MVAKAVASLHLGNSWVGIFLSRSHTSPSYSNLMDFSPSFVFSWAKKNMRSAGLSWSPDNIHACNAPLCTVATDDAAKVGQMLSWSTTNSSHSINIRDIVTQVVLLYSLHQAPTYEPNFTLLAPLSMMLAHLSMLFLWELGYTACSAHQLKNK